MHFWFQTPFIDALLVSLPQSSMHKGLQLPSRTHHRCIWRLEIRWWIGVWQESQNVVMVIRWWIGVWQESKKWQSNDDGSRINQIDVVDKRLLWALMKGCVSNSFHQCIWRLEIHWLWGHRGDSIDQQLENQHVESTSCSQKHRSQCIWRLEIHWWKVFEFGLLINGRSAYVAPTQVWSRDCFA